MGTNLSKIAPFVAEGAEIRISGEGVQFSGAIAMRNPSQSLTPYLHGLHKAAVGDEMRELRVDFTKLRFMNSSSIRSLIDWVEWIHKEPVSQRYKLRFVSNPSVTWQQTTLSVIRTFSDGEVIVDQGDY
jgi:hypothetical protein